MKKLIAALLTLVIMLAGVSVPALGAAERFSDVKPGSWYYTAVDYVVSHSLFDGTSPTTFSPKGTFTRGMIVKVLGDMEGIDTSKYPGTHFSDVKPGDWYAPYVLWAVTNDIVESSGRFEPKRPVTREEMAVIFYNYGEYAGCDIATRGGLLERFSDGGTVSKDARYAMMWALTHGVLNGSGDKLDPQGTATRAQVAQIFYNCRELFKGDEGREPGPITTPPQSPDIPQIIISDEVRAKFKPNQNPEKILEYVLHGKHDDPTFSYDGTTAKWDPSIISSPDVGVKRMGSWGDIEDDKRGSAAIANGFQMMLTRTASDRFYITAEESDGCFSLYYTPSDVPDSQSLFAVKAALDLPDPKRESRSLCYEGAGWAGPMSLEWYTPEDIAGMIEYYLCEVHTYTTEYYITEPSPGVFYLLYG